MGLVSASCKEKTSGQRNQQKTSLKIHEHTILVELKREINCGYMVLFQSLSGNTSNERQEGPFDNKPT